MSRLTDPASEMVCVLDGPAAQVVAEGSVTPKRGAQTRTYRRRFDIRVDRDDKLYLTNERGDSYASLDDVSKDLLQSVLFPS